MPNDQHQYDVLVIGSGASGLSLALQIAEYADVAVLSKAALSEGATLYAQGGISAVLDVYDTIDSHVEDTLKAGAGLCNQEIVRFVVEQGRESIQWLIDIGVNFTKNPIPNGHEYHLHQEGGHSHRRIIHAADSTGKEIENTLEGLVRVHPRISLFDHHTAVDLITAAKLGLTDNRCLGAYVYDQKHDKVKVFRARFTVLATGGAGKVYLYTSNPDICTGDGIAIACRAGCRVANMEFIQFHPTCLYHPEAKSFLLSEALRGEGAKLRLPDGQSFLDKYDSREELAPRDIVARAIDNEMKKRGDDYVLLDCTHLDQCSFVEHFPTITAKCKSKGIDVLKQMIPVVPACHYFCGGIVVDHHGQSSIGGLLAAGECTCSGLHGANRLASNSLLEGLVYAKRIANRVVEVIDGLNIKSGIPGWDAIGTTEPKEMVLITQSWKELKEVMSNYVGIVRSNVRLKRAMDRLWLLYRETEELYNTATLSPQLCELRNLITIGYLVTRSAQMRHESRGLHYTTDDPGQHDHLENTYM